MPEERELTKKENEYLYGKAKCPMCRNGELIGGPCGGMAQNVMCGTCGSEYWWAPPFTAKLMKRDPSRASTYGFEHLPGGDQPSSILFVNRVDRPGQPDLFGWQRILLTVKGWFK